MLEYVRKSSLAGSWIFLVCSLGSAAGAALLVAVGVAYARLSRLDQFRS